MRAVLVLAMLLASLSPAFADPLRVFAAGSLSGPFNALLQTFGAESAAIAPPVYGPSGLLRARIERGRKLICSLPPISASRAAWRRRAKAGR